MKRLLLSLLLGLCAAAAAEFPEPYDSEMDTSQPRLSPQEAAAGFKLPEGFKVNVFAAEPEVRNPIAMAWDRRGRMWVAENYTYAEKGVRFDETLSDRVVIFEDRDQDGVAETHKVFTQGLKRLTSIELGRGGVWLMCPPQVLFIADSDRDDVPDAEPVVVLDGFEVGESNYHNLANGLRWGPDGWLYGRCGHSCPAKIGKPGTPESERLPMKGGLWRYHPERLVAEVLVHGTTNPWGHDWDRHGEGFFINVVNGHLWHLIPGAHYKESFGAPMNPLVFERLDTIADHWHYDKRGKWSDSRDGAANDLGGGHAHVGMMIYQGKGWPEAYQNRLFTLNLHGRRANVERLERHESTYIGRHEPDMLVAADKWFRGIDIRQGPDGCAYVLDWSDIGECHEHNGVHRNSGRIYRISHGTVEKVSFEDLTAPLTLESMERLLRLDNPWWERQMRVRLHQGEAPQGGAEFLRARMLDTTEPVEARLRALWALEAVWGAQGESGREALLLRLLDDASEHARVWGLRLLLDDRALDAGDGRVRMDDAKLEEPIKARLVRMAKEDDSALVRLFLASAMQRLPLSQRGHLALALLSHKEDAGDAYLPSMVWYGLMLLVKVDSGELMRVAKQCAWPDTLRWISRGVAVRVEEDAAAVDDLVSLASSTNTALRLAILQGMGEAFAGWRKAPMPRSWEKVVKLAAGDDAAEALARELSVLFGDGRALADVVAMAKDEAASVEQRAAALKSLIEARSTDLREICITLLDARGLAVAAARGLALFDDPSLGREMLKRWPRYNADERAQIVGILVSRPAWAALLLDEVAAGKVVKQSLTATHARQVQAHDDTALTAKLAEVWGVVKESDEAKRRVIAELKAAMTPEVLASADLVQGRRIYQLACMSCHVLHGEGGKVGPDLTGSGRANLDYLLENIVDPSAVVGADYRMTVVTLKDGRVLSGMVSATSERTITLRQVAEEITLEKAEISRQETLAMSMMPEGALQGLSAEQRRDLLAYLMHPNQVPLPE